MCSFLTSISLTDYFLHFLGIVRAFRYISAECKLKNPALLRRLLLIHYRYKHYRFLVNLNVHVSTDCIPESTSVLNCHTLLSKQLH